MKPIAFIAALFLIAISFAMKPAAVVSEIAGADTAQTRTVILLRHAKSDKSDMVMLDIHRPLEESGKAEAKEMGEYLKENIEHIDAIYSSPSTRTRQTLEIICPIIGYDYSKIIWDSTLYACTGEHLQQKIIETDEQYRTVMYVGHNPSITTVANSLQSDKEIDEVKTCGAVAIDFTELKWAEIQNEKGTLRFYHKPK